MSKPEQNFLTTEELRSLLFADLQKTGPKEGIKLEQDVFTTEVDYFLKALGIYRDINNRNFTCAREIFWIIERLGYKRV